MERTFHRLQDLMFLTAIAMALKGLWNLGVDIANRNKPIQ
jgi:hypothetical protein